MGEMLRQILHEVSFRTKRVFPGDQKWNIFGYDLILPRSHRLPTLQKIHPKYDKYFFSIFHDIDQLMDDITFFDVGANVGDTSIAYYACSPKSQIVAIEGSETFIPYLSRNLASISGNFKIVPKFVACEMIAELSYNDDGSTGGFESMSSDIQFLPIKTVSVTELLALKKDSFGIWKSDTDGMDIPIILENYELIESACGVLWLEIHPHLFPTNPDLVIKFAQKIADSNRSYLIFDNYGNFISRGSSSDLEDELTSWCQKLQQPRRIGSRLPIYLDIFAFDLESYPSLNTLLETF